MTVCVTHLKQQQQQDWQQLSCLGDKVGDKVGDGVGDKQGDNEGDKGGEKLGDGVGHNVRDSPAPVAPVGGMSAGRQCEGKETEHGYSVLSQHVCAVSACLSVCKLCLAAINVCLLAAD